MMSNRHITREALAWLIEEEKRVADQLRLKESELTEGIDPGSWKQTSNVDDARVAAHLLNQQLTQIRETLAAPIIVEHGQNVGGVVIGTRITFEDHDGTETVQILPKWDVAMVQSRGGKAITDSAPVVREMLSSKAPSFQFRGGKVVVS